MLTTTMTEIEQITDTAGKVLAVIARAEYTPEATSFVTPDSFTQQLGFIVYPAGGQVDPHSHLPLERHLSGTSEAIMVRSGRAILSIYDDDRLCVYKTTMVQGDVVVLVAGGHGFKMLEDTVLMEIKQGPYSPLPEKERFYIQEQ